MHELRLHGDPVIIQPYCVCGWVGDPQDADQTTIVTRAYRNHLPDYYMPTIGSTSAAFSTWSYNG